MSTKTLTWKVKVDIRLKWNWKRLNLKKFWNLKCHKNILWSLGKNLWMISYVFMNSQVLFEISALNNLESLSTNYLSRVLWKCDFSYFLSLFLPILFWNAIFLLSQPLSVIMMTAFDFGSPKVCFCWQITEF